MEIVFFLHPFFKFFVIKWFICTTFFSHNQCFFYQYPMVFFFFQLSEAGPNDLAYRSIAATADFLFHELLKMRA